MQICARPSNNDGLHQSKGGSMKYETWLKAVHVDNKRGTAQVKSHRTGRAFPVTLHHAIRYDVNIGDHLHVITSHVSREWIAIDYKGGVA